jgi:hypothetical protein
MALNHATSLCELRTFDGKLGEISQTSRVTGHVRVGDEAHELRGGGLWIRRQGVRRLAAFLDQTWQSAVFPTAGRLATLLPAPR